MVLKMVSIYGGFSAHPGVESANPGCHVILQSRAKNSLLLRKSTKVNKLRLVRIAWETHPFDLRMGGSSIVTTLLLGTSFHQVCLWTGNI